MIFYKAKTYFQGKFDFRDLYITACYYICVVSIYFKEDYRIIFIKTYANEKICKWIISLFLWAKSFCCVVLISLLSENIYISRYLRLGAMWCQYIHINDFISYFHQNWSRCFHWIQFKIVAKIIAINKTLNTVYKFYLVPRIWNVVHA